MKYILQNIEGHIATITIDRPEALNALNEKVIGELTIAFKEMIQSDRVGVIILTGTGEKSFIAGADIKAMQAMNQSSALEFGKKGQMLTKIIEDSGGIVTTSVSKNTDYLLFGENPGSKYEKAQNLKVRTISEKDFEGLINK